MWILRRSKGSDPEAQLRANRAEPRKEFVRELAARVDGQPPRRVTPWSRLAFAGAASTFILGMFATVGGFGYVASGATASYSAAKQVVVKHKLAVAVHRSSASGEYPNNPPAEPPHQDNGVAGQSQSQASGVAGVASAKTLPFTGISLLTTVLLGCALLALGLILRRRERNRA